MCTFAYQRSSCGDSKKRCLRPRGNRRGPSTSDCGVMTLVFRALARSLSLGDAPNSFVRLRASHPATVMCQNNLEFMRPLKSESMQLIVT